VPQTRQINVMPVIESNHGQASQPSFGDLVLLYDWQSMRRTGKRHDHRVARSESEERLRSCINNA